MADFLYFLASVAVFGAGFYAAARLTMLPLDLFLRDEPAPTAAEFREANPRLAWVVDWFPFAMFPMVPLFFLPMFVLAQTKSWLLVAGLFPFVGVLWLFLPMAVLELTAGVTLLLSGKGSRRPMRVIRSPRVRQAGAFRLAVTAVAFAAVTGVVVAVRP